MELIIQPEGRLRLGEYLLARLSDRRWDEFRAAVAFVKRSGTQHICEALRRFDGGARVRLSVGVDMLGTSREGLEDLLRSVVRGRIWVFHNSGPWTFHPKVYLFKNRHQAHLLVGSGNLTEGGLYTNYETSLAVELDRGNASDAALLASAEALLDGWSRETRGLCRRLTPRLLQQLVAGDLVRTEQQIAAAAQQVVRGRGVRRPRARAAFVFRSISVPAAPRLARVRRAAPLGEAAATAAETLERPAPAGSRHIELGGASSFVMTLQNTDVGVGQTTAGTARRSPEIFIPLAALDANPTFWKFPEQFTSDETWNRRNPQYRRNGLGKLDREGVPIRIGIMQLVNMFFNPQKKDFRLRNEVLRSAGEIDDILMVRAVDPAEGFEYEVQVAPRGSLLFGELEPYCNVLVPNSRKRFGYF